MPFSKYFSIDIETTGLDINCQIIQIGVVYADLNNPSFRKKFLMYIDHGEFKGEPYALGMHAKIFQKIDELRRIVPNLDFSHIPCERFCFEKREDFMAVCVRPEDVGNTLADWITRVTTEEDKKAMGSRIIVAGKNAAMFDIPRIEKLIPGFKTTHRVIDLGNLFWDPIVDGSKLPSLDVCKQRAGLEPTVSHDALDDALDICDLINKFYESKLFQVKLE